MRFFNALKKTPMLIIFILILIFFTPIAVFSPGENKNRAIVTAVGIEKIEDDYEVSFLTFIPTPNQTYKETNSVVSGKGKSIAEAIYKAQLNLGKDIGLSHAKTTILGQSLLKEDLSKTLDYLGRVASLSENTVLIATNANVKEFLITTQSLDKDLGLKLENLVGYNASKVYLTDTSLEAFYKGYYSPIKSSLIGYLSVEEIEESSVDAVISTGESGQSSGDSKGGASSGGGNGGSEGSSGGEPATKKQIVNRADTMLIREGKMVEKLSEEMLNSLNLLNPDAVDQTIRIEHVNDENYTDTDLTYAIREKKVLTSSKFENGCLIYCTNVILDLELLEMQSSGKEDILLTELSKITPKVQQKLQGKLKKDYAKMLSVLRKNKTDIIGVYEYFKKNDRANFDKFLENLDDPDDFLNFINFQLVIKVQAN